METPREYYYTYYSYEEWGRGYIGSRGCECLPEEDISYFGSFYDKEFYPTQKIILGIYGTREEAIEAEIILHDFYDVAKNPHFVNQAKQTSTKFHYIHPIEESTKLGNKVKELGLGIHGWTKEQFIENGKKSGKRCFELGVGIHRWTKEQKIENGKKCAKIVKELGVGIFAMTADELSEAGKKGASQRWECLETGFISGPGPLTNYQRNRGIDTSKRKRIE